MCKLVESRPSTGKICLMDHALRESNAVVTTYHWANQESENEVKIN